VRWVRLAAYIALLALGSGLTFAGVLALGRTLGNAGIARDLDPALRRGFFVLLLCLGMSVAFEIAGRVTGYFRFSSRHRFFILTLMALMIGWWTGVEILFRDLPVSELAVFLVTSLGMLGIAWIGERCAPRFGISLSGRRGPA
jgi:hypothetical protein